MKAYGQNKIATIYMANTIDRRLGAEGLHALSLHPGVIRSSLTAHVLKLADPMWEISTVKAREKTAAQSAATAVYAAVGGDWEGRGGRYLSECFELGPFQGKEGYSCHG